MSMFYKAMNIYSTVYGNAGASVRRGRIEEDDIKKGRFLCKINYNSV